MKYAILVLAAVVLSFSAQAQTNKQVAGSKSFEVQFAPLSGSPISLDGGIRFRTFSTESTAFRGTVFLGGNSSTDLSLEPDFEGDNVEVASKTSTFSVQLRPGMEWHLVGTDKLSPYYGAEAIIGFSSDKSVDEFYVVNDTFDGGSIEEMEMTQGTTSFGVNAVGGMDYYFAQNIFFGAEIGAGILYNSTGEATSTSTVEGAEDVVTPGGSSLTGGPNFNGRIRLGIIF